jgi:hypothetical protein
MVRHRTGDPTEAVYESTSKVRFEVDPVLQAVTSVVDGHALHEIVTEFEMNAGFTPAGGYGGVIHLGLRFGALDSYYLATSWTYEGKVELLACAGCGELGCPRG